MRRSILILGLLIIHAPLAHAGDLTDAEMKAALEKLNAELAQEIARSEAKSKALGTAAIAVGAGMILASLAESDTYSDEAAAANELNLPTDADSKRTAWRLVGLLGVFTSTLGVVTLLK